MTTLKTNAVEPEGATTTLTVGLSGQNVVIGGSGGLKVNTFKDAGGGYKYAAFRDTGAATWTCPSNVTSAEILIVAGGGGGGGEHYAGGGGAGGVVHDENYTVVPGVVYDITVGAGGAANAANGSNSVWNVNAEGSGITMTAIGGGRGGYGGGGSNPNGQPGGSGGGNDNDSSQSGGGTSTQTSPTGAVGYGNAGGDDTGQAGGGGGGAGSAGAQGASTNKGGAGGDGKYFTNFADYGENGYFAGGGGGGAYNVSDTGGAAGIGGGGKGQGNDGLIHNAGMPNTGGGGGGASVGSNSNNGTGGSGIVIIRYADPAINTLWTSNGSGVVTGGGLTDTVLISSQTVANQASVSFTSGIDSTYKEYVFEYINIHPESSAPEFSFQVSTNGGSSYGVTTTSAFWRAYHTQNDSAATFGYTTGRDIQSGTGFIPMGFDVGNGNNDECANGVLHLFNPSSTTYAKLYYGRCSLQQDSNAAFDGFVNGYINTTTAVNAVQFKCSAGNMSGTIKMYGIK